MSIGREELIQAAIHGEKARRAEARDFYTDLRKKADADPDTALAMMGGREPNPGIIRANIDESIGSRREDGTMDHDSDPKAKDRFDRAEAAVVRIESYLSVEDFSRLPSADRTRLIDYTVDNVLLQHPVFRKYLRGFGAPNVVRGKAKQIAEAYLTDPKTREALQEAVRAAKLSTDMVEDTLSEAAQKLRALGANEATLNSRKAALEGASGEIKQAQDRKAEFAPGKAGLAEIAKLQGELATIEINRKAAERKVEATKSEISKAQKEKDIRDGKITVRAGYVSPYAPTFDIDGEVTRLQGELTTAEGELIAATEEKIKKQSEIDSIQEEKRTIDETIAAKVKELQEVNASLAEIAKQRGEVHRLRVAKGIKEEECVAELEAVFQKGIEASLVERYGGLQEEAKTQSEERKAVAADYRDKKMEDEFMHRYLTPPDTKGRVKINGAQINADYSMVMGPSRDVTIRGNKYLLTGPEQVVYQMMIAPGSGFSREDIEQKLRDKDWMTQQSEKVSQEVLKQKFIASRGIKGIGIEGGKVSKFKKGELLQLSQMPWATDWLKHAIEADTAKREMFEEAFGSGAVDESFWNRATEKLGGGKRGNIMLIALLIAAGIITGSAAAAIIPLLPSLGGQAVHVMRMAGTHTPIGAAAGAAAGVGAAGVAASRRN